MTQTDGRRCCYEEQDEGAPSEIQRPADQGCYSHACDPERFSGCPADATSVRIGRALVEHPGRSECTLRFCQCSIDGIKALCHFKSDGLCEIHSTVPCWQFLPTASENLHASRRSDIMEPFDGTGGSSY